MSVIIIIIIIFSLLDLDPICLYLPPWIYPYLSYLSSLFDLGQVRSAEGLLLSRWNARASSLLGTDCMVTSLGTPVPYGK